jgi:hypothetical protein
MLILEIKRCQWKSDIGRGHGFSARVLQRPQGVQDYAMGKPAAAGLGLAADAPAGSVDPAMIYVAAPGTEPVNRSAEAGAKRESWPNRFHHRILQRS